MKFFNDKNFWTTFLQPFFIALFPVVFLYSNNYNQIFLDEFLLLFVIIFLITLSFLLLLNYFFKDYSNNYCCSKASFFLSVFYLFFWFLLPISRLLAQIRICNIQIIKFRYIFFLAIAFLIWLFIKLLKKKNIHNSLNKFLILPLFVLILYSLSNIFFYNFQFNKKVIEAEKLRESFFKSHFKFFENKKDKDLPDIYFIILDRYQSRDGLIKRFDFDNINFLNDLEKKGFYVVEKGFSNYPNTTSSLLSTLNLDYLGNKELCSEPASYIINRSIVRKFLKKAGYKYISLPSTSSLTDRHQVDSEFKFDYPSFVSPNFLFLLFKDSFLYTPSYSFWIYKTRKFLINQLNALKKCPEIQSPTIIVVPKFVFAHFVCPHGPYVFDKDGNYPKRNFLNGDLLISEKQAYVEQLVFMNKKIDIIIDCILKYSKKKPIIILQSDHGVATKENYERTEGSYGILNAIYLPNVNQDKIFYKTVSSVNTFRIIFNTLFNTNFELLKDE